MSSRRSLRSDVTRATTLAIQSLVKRQLRDGNFRLCELRGRDDPTILGETRSPFGTAVVLNTWNMLGLGCTPPARHAADSLLTAMDPPGVWRFWRDPATLDADLDDTACALRALTGTHPRVAAGAWPELFWSARDHRGRFHTWFRAAGEANDADPVVNANVLWWLDDAGRAGKAISYVGTALAENARSSYYAHPLALCHAVARLVRDCHGFRRTLLPRLRNAIATQISRDQHLQCATFAAVALTAMVAARSPQQHVLAAVEFLVTNQCRDGAWPATAYVCGPAGRPPRFWWGDESMTMAFALEALHVFAQKAWPS